MTWGGLRGGISIALALSLPELPAARPLVATTYAIVIFSILVQALTLGADDEAVLPRALTRPRRVRRARDLRLRLTRRAQGVRRPHGAAHIG